MAATAVTPSGVRDGDPDALAGLCDRRGPAVLAYCEVVAGHAAAPSAAAEAFGSFRAGVVATPDLANLNPEALLISATRHAAARHAAANTAGQCARVPALLAARADRSITLADHDWLEQHLATCWSCRAPVARFEAADRAYREPPDDGLAPEVTAAIVAAMTAAAPVRGSTVPTPAVAGDGAYAAYHEPHAPANNGHEPHEDLSAVVAEPLDQPTSAYEIPAPDLALPPAPDEPRTARERRGRRAGLLGGVLAAGRSRRGDAAAPTAGPPSTDRAAAASHAAGAAASGRRPRRDVRTGSAIEPRAAGGASLPRPSRIAAAGAVRRREHSRLRAGIVLPVALVIIAIIAALAVAGVFGGGEPESAPQSFAPTESVPSNTAETPVVVVPGAAARAAAVEKAKARARAAERKRKAAATDSASAEDAPATVAPPPAAAATPAAAPAAPPPPPPAAANTGSTSGKPKIDAGNGATGAEQLPPPQDTSTIPEIAPPVEPSAPPGE